MERKSSSGNLGNLPSIHSFATLKRLSSRIFSAGEIELRETRKTHKKASSFKTPAYVAEQEGSLIASIENYKYDIKELKEYSREPSFSNFKVSYNVICAARYRKARDDYNAQFEREIKMLINYSPTANDATSLVRWTSYTTFWPPYHNLAELKETSKTFYKLSKKQQHRLNKIMNTDFL